MDYFKNLKSRITPQKTQPTHAEQLAKFRKAWIHIEVSGGDSTFTDEPPFFLVKADNYFNFSWN
jgi:hypothetical protein